MKVLVICNSASGLHDFRGMLLKRFVSEGNNVSAIIPVVNAPTEQKAEKALEAEQIQLLRIPMERRGMNPIKDFKLLLNYIKAIHKEKPNLVITYTIKPNAYGGIACQICKVPYAINVTGLGTSFQGNGMLRKFVTALYKIAFGKATVVFFENEENRDVIVNAGIIGKDRTHVLHGAGVDLERFPHLEYPEEHDCTRFLFIGRVMQEKGIDELFAAMRILRENEKNCTLDILGGFDEDYSEKIKECEAEGWLTYHGYQSDVRPFILNSHCFVLPSWHEGMANTNLECAASARPVITSDIPGCREAVIPGETGLLCKPQDAKSLAEAMEAFCAMDQAARIAMGLAGRRHMEEVFDKNKVVAATIAALPIRE